MKKALIVTLSLAMIFALTSCGFGKLLLKAVEQDASLLVGTWESEYGTIIEFTEDQVCMNVDDDPTFTNYRTDAFSLYVEVGSGVEESFTFEVSKDTLILKITESSAVFSEKYTRVK